MSDGKGKKRRYKRKKVTQNEGKINNYYEYNQNVDDLFKNQYKEDSFDSLEYFRGQFCIEFFLEVALRPFEDAEDAFLE